MTGCREQFTFPFYPSKQVVADFQGGLITSDAGLLPIRELDQRLGWTGRVAEQIADARPPEPLRYVPGHAYGAATAAPSLAICWSVRARL